MSLLAVAAGMKAVSAIAGARSSRQSGKESIALAGQQEQMAYENRELEMMELEENIRRTELNNRLTRGSARSRASASGLGKGGSLDEYLGFMESTQGDEVDWMRSAGESRAEMNLQSGLLQAESTRMSGRAQKRQATTSLLGGVAGIATLFV